jgi:hypothetical protein
MKEYVKRVECRDTSQGERRQQPPQREGKEAIVMVLEGDVDNRETRESNDGRTNNFPAFYENFVDLLLESKKDNSPGGQLSHSRVC